MLVGLFSTKQDHNTHSFSFGKLHQTKHNGIECSKITLKSSSTKNYEILKAHGHPNIIPVLKLSKQSVYSRRIVPFGSVFEPSRTEYNRYVLERVKDALTYIHSVLKMEFRAISMDSLAVDENGRVLLCNFERTRPLETPEGDFEMLMELRKELLGRGEEEPCDELSSGIFDRIAGFDISAARAETKLPTLEEVSRNKGILPTALRERIFDIFAFDASKETNKQYKSRVFEILYGFDEGYFRKSVKRLFSILDSTVRVYLLDKFMGTELTAEELQGIAGDLSLGLQVKDATVKRKSIDFVFGHEFSKEAMEHLLDAMGVSVDGETTGVVCRHLLSLERDRLTKPIYRLLYIFLDSGSCADLVYSCIERYFPLFDKVKLAREILPLLCSRLIEKEHQEQCFGLLEKIVKYLRSHKEDLQSKESMLKSIKGIFGKRTTANKFEERVSKFSKEDLDEWKDSEFE